MSADPPPGPSLASPVLSPITAPRPLQLVNGSVPAVVDSPTSASSLQSPLHGLGISTPPPSGRAFKPPNPRRQSSISYYSSDHVSSFEGRPSVQAQSGRRCNSMGIWGEDLQLSGISKLKGDRRSLSALSREPMSARLPPSADHGPVTLTEKCVASFLLYRSIAGCGSVTLRDRVCHFARRGHGHVGPR